MERVAQWPILESKGMHSIFQKKGKKKAKKNKQTNKQTNKKKLKMGKKEPSI